MHCIAYRFLLLALFFSLPLIGADVQSGEKKAGDSQTFWLANELIQYSIFIDKTALKGDRLQTLASWVAQPGAKPPALETDANFALDIVWTDWRAPGKRQNADNPVILDKGWFRFDRAEESPSAGGGKELRLHFVGDKEREIPLALTLAISLRPGDFFVHRTLTVSDPGGPRHFLDRIWPLQARILTDFHPVKPGDFGQPVALRTADGGFFFGLELPSSQNELRPDRVLACGQEVGERISPNGVSSDPVVSAVTPDANVKLWFFRYLDTIRVAPLRPYTLYNSWYDLRSPQYPGITPDHVMNEANVLAIIDRLRRSMIEAYGIQLDAFVLDDGWDVYRSDWELRKDQFPRGLSPIAAELRRTGTRLGLWLGPTGGYSFRKDRLEWMSQHGYESVDGQLCLAGQKYRELLKKRLVDFASREGASYFKWDGIQFSCSDPSHGHPTGIYSRRAVLHSLIDLCRSVRSANPDMFLNITSGTWLSPWWVQYADAIWMDGMDYGHADVPSCSPRDSAITYRDFVLYEDFKEKDLWFPIANLMTHGIIKGKLEMLGGENEPLEKFTDEALFYLARGVAMWELYISPDMLSAGEWRAMSRALQWARDRFSVLQNTFMIGGDPRRGEAYGYVHFAGNRGILALRNPTIESRQVRVALAPSLGLDAGAASLVLERTYPYRWVSPELYSAGASIDISLAGYETAIFEVYPLQGANEPLFANAAFDSNPTSGSARQVDLFWTTGPVRLLNPETVAEMRIEGEPVLPLSPITTRTSSPASPLSAPLMATMRRNRQSDARLAFTLAPDLQAATLAVLITPSPSSRGKKIPAFGLRLDGRDLALPGVRQEEGWTWLTAPISPGTHRAEVLFAKPDAAPWQGRAQAWIICRQPHAKTKIQLTPRREARPRPLPPKPWPADQARLHLRIGEAELEKK